LNINYFNQRFLDFIQQHKLLEKQDKIIAAISGGVDSVVMCKLLAENGFRFAITHANFGLRGKDSDEDEKFVKGLAKQYKVEFFSRKFDTWTYASAHRISIEMAARELRYNWFYDLLTQYNLTKIATAHHQTDHAETLILNLARGTGIRGMHGILPLSGAVVRPMLFTNRAEIEEYANENQILFRTDKSNENLDFKRNLIRHKVIPVLKQLNPKLEETLFLHSAYMAEYEKFISDHLEEMKNLIVSYKNDQVKIDFGLLYVLKYKNLILYEILRAFGFNYETVLDINRLTDRISGKRFLSPDYELVKDRKYLILSPIKKEITEMEKYVLTDSKFVTLGKCKFVCIKLPKTERLEDLKNANVAYLDFEKLKFPLKIRFWQKADFFIPFGMKTRKKLSDFFIENKIPVNEKKNIPIFLSGDDIIWIAGFRIDNRYRINDNTEVLFKIKCE